MPTCLGIIRMFCLTIQHSGLGLLRFVNVHQDRNLSYSFILGNQKGEKYSLSNTHLFLLNKHTHIHTHTHLKLSSSNEDIYLKNTWKAITCDSNTIFEIIQVRCFQLLFAIFLSKHRFFPNTLQSGLPQEKGPAQLESTCQRAEASVKGWQQLHPCESWLFGRWLPA